jgi:hypothetical protein
MTTPRSSISFIVPTIGRASLARTLESIETLPGDEILVVASMDTNTHNQSFVMNNPYVRCLHCPPGHDWGHSERNFATPFARGAYLAHIDDDDIYAPAARAAMADAIERTPGRPTLFRMRFPNGITLWQEPVLRCGNIGTPCILIPNEPAKLGLFRPFVGGDCAYLEEMAWPQSEIVWRPEIIALLGHNT